MKLRKLSALFLVLAILLVSLPFNSIVSFADDGDAEKIEAIKNAWEHLEPVYTQVTPNGGGSSLKGVTAAYSAANDLTILPDGAKDLPENLGSAYVKATVGTTATKSTLNSYGSSFLKYAAIGSDITNCNVYLNIYVEEVNGELSILPFYRRTGSSGYNSGKEYFITSENAGSWITLSGEDIATEAFGTTIDNLANSIILCINSTDDNTLYIGSFIITKKHHDLPENTDNWNLAQWVSEAKKVDTTGLRNVEAFNAVVAAAEAEESVAEILAIKNAWTVMQKNVLELEPILFGAGVSGFSVNDSEGLRKEVGSKYATVITGTTADNTVSALSGSGNFVKYHPSEYDVSVCNVIFSFYIEELEGEVSFVPYFRVGNSGGGNTGKEYVVTEDDVGKWVTLSTADLISDTFSSVVTDLHNGIVLGINSTAANEIKLGSFIFTEAVTPPEESSGWSATKWKKNAKDFDFSDCFGTEEFEELIPTFDIPYEDLINAYEYVNVPVFFRFPHRLTSTVGGEISTIGVYGLVQDSEFVGINPQLLSYEYATYTYGEADEEALLFENGDQAAYLESANRAYLYYKVNSDNREDKSQDITITPVIYWTNSNSTVLDSFTISADGNWNKLTDEDMFGEGGIVSIYNGAYGGATPLYRIVFRITNASGANITFGSMLFEGKATLPSSYDEFGEEDWIYETYKLRRYVTYNNTEALDSLISPFEAGIEFGDIDSNSMIDIRDLVELKKYSISGTYLLKGDLYKDAYLNGEDINAMVILLLED